MTASQDTARRDRRRVWWLRRLLGLCAHLSLPLAHALGVLLGAALVLLPNRLRRYTTVNLRLCFPELDAAARRRLAQRSLLETGKTLAELGALWRWERTRLLMLVRETRGEEAVEAAMAAGRGVIMACPHMGAWELGGLYCSARWPMTTLYRPPRLAGLEEDLNRARSRLGAHLVPIGGAGIRALYQTLREGAMVCLLPDQDPARGNGVFAPFFGLPAYSMTLLTRLAQKSGAAVFIGYAERLPRGRGYRLHFLAAPPEVADPDPSVAVAAMNRAVERCARACPEQYQWGYPRFKTRPEGEPDPYCRQRL